MIRVTEYTANALPADHPGYSHCSVQVVETSYTDDNGFPLWTVRHWPDGVLNATGEWDKEPRPAHRTRQWWAHHSWPEDQARGAAEEAARELADAWRAKYGDE